MLILRIAAHFWSWAKATVVTPSAAASPTAAIPTNALCFVQLIAFLPDRLHGFGCRDPFDDANLDDASARRRRQGVIRRALTCGTASALAPIRTIDHCHAIGDSLPQSPRRT
jgi:hypothetical protein